LKIYSSIDSPVDRALKGVPERCRYALVVMGRNSVSFSDSSLRSSFTSSRPMPYSSLASFLETASSSPSNNSLAVSRQCAEVVFVEDHEVPLHLVEPFVLRLDVPCRVAT
jgi:hypothetical protein